MLNLYSHLKSREIVSIDSCGRRKSLYGALDFVERLQLKTSLYGHKGCVNSVFFSDDGNLIFTGSDDTKVNIYNSESGDLVESIQTLHTNNVFYAKDLPGTSSNILLTCAADGRVIMHDMERGESVVLYRHVGRAHRLSMIPGQSSQFLSCGEDGRIAMFDIRESVRCRLYMMTKEETLPSFKRAARSSPVVSTNFYNSKSRVSSVYSVGINPMQPFEVAVGGCSNHVSMFDSRMFSKPFGFLCPSHLAHSSGHVTGLKYSSTGETIVASYNDELIYNMDCTLNLVSEFRVHKLQPHELSINNDKKRSLDEMMSSNSKLYEKEDTQEMCDSIAIINNRRNNGIENDQNSSSEEEEIIQNGYIMKYSGHQNQDTVKQVAFFGQRSEYVVSGSDCGNIFIWNTYSGKLVNLLTADNDGAVNCLSSHPFLPYLASSGLEDTAKIWAPIGAKVDPKELTDKLNAVDEKMNENANDRLMYFIARDVSNANENEEEDDS
eukprot:gene10942-14692_t